MPQTTPDPPPPPLEPRVVKQDKSSRGSVDTTKTRSGPQRVGMSGGERGLEAPPKANKLTPWPRAPPPLYCAAPFLRFHLLGPYIVLATWFGNGCTVGGVWSDAFLACFIMTPVLTSVGGSRRQAFLHVTLSMALALALYSVFLVKVARDGTPGSVLHVVHAPRTRGGGGIWNGGIWHDKIVPPPPLKSPPRGGDRHLGPESIGHTMRQRRQRKSPRREVVRSSAGTCVVYPPFLGVIRVAYPKA